MRLYQSILSTHARASACYRIYIYPPARRIRSHGFLKSIDGRSHWKARTRQRASAELRRLEGRHSQRRTGCVFELIAPGQRPSRIPSADEIVSADRICWGDILPPEELQTRKDGNA